MATKKESSNGLLPNQIIIAEGSDNPRKHTLKILRGRAYRDKHLRLLSTFAQLEGVSSAMANGQGGLREIIQTIGELFGEEGFAEEMLPFALGMESEEELEYLDQLTPLEQFMAYMQGAAYIVNGASSDGVQAALKK